MDKPKTAPGVLHFNMPRKLRKLVFSGHKTVEGMINCPDGLLSQTQFITEGCIIRFTDPTEYTPAEYLPLVKVTAVRMYKTLADFLAIEGIKHILPGVKTLKKGIRICRGKSRRWYDPYDFDDEGVQEHGIVAIEFVLIK